MNIEYVNPLSRAWGRMKKALFQPFDLKKWFIVGFSVFLADLMDGSYGNGPSGIHDGKHADLDNFFDFPRIAWEWLMAHPVWFTLIIFGVVFLIVLTVLLTWLSSRGKFMFLDNVVHDRAQIVKPWNEFKEHGNSLFLWRLVFGLICLCVVIVFVATGFSLAARIYHGSLKAPESVLLVVVLALVALFAFVIIGFISLFLNNFIIPIMYRNNIGTNQAWQQFLSLFSSYPFHFILYGLFLFVLYVAVVICVIIACLLTCCIGFLFLIIPYINAVVLLPISYAFRAFSLEFLGQFGPGFVLFPDEKIEQTGEIPA